ncbi:RNA-guided endonuclease InsQ/TnpB family protein [Absiella sp. AM29-15]|uniref:RNA-guided endonuclease InsQ/TnpB family protein n=1 Tax=Absiella sp. AM29-15 TaxID=2292278 RepID=UPI001F35DDE2|nr:transposase [Absiella sp. AM29-15]
MVKEKEPDDKNYRVFRCIIKPTHTFYEPFLLVTHLAKNLYNIGMFYIRNAYSGAIKSPQDRFLNEANVINDLNGVIDQLNEIRLYDKKTKQKKKKPGKMFSKINEENRFVSYELLDGLFKVMNQVDYRALHSHVAQQVLRMLMRDWDSFFKILKKYRNDPTSLKAAPHIPNYADKNGYKTATFTNLSCDIRKDKKGGYVQFPKIVKKHGFPSDRFYIGKLDMMDKDFKQIRLVPEEDHIVMEIVYEIKAVEDTVDVETTERIAGIDIGVNNLASIAFTTGHQPVIVKGRKAKSVNQRYNKVMAHLQSEHLKGKKQETHIRTKRMKRETRRRNNQMDDFMHKKSRKIVDTCMEENVEVIVIGNNKDWKQNINLGKKNNQNFVQMPFQKFIKMIKYKAEAAGIKVMITEESYTSKASSIDEDQIPCYGEEEKEYTFSGKRIKRGLYRSKEGILINADINGASNIIRKVYPCKPKLKERWYRGTVNVPVMCI